MSSYISAAQLEAQRKEDLRRRLNESINIMKENLSSYTSNDTGSTISYGNIHSVVFHDETSSSFSFSGEVGKSSMEGTEISDREGNDFSSLLSVGNKRQQKMKKLHDSIKRIDDRAVLYIKDEADRKKIEETVQRILDDDSLDLDAKIEMINLKVNNYLLSGTLVTDVDKEFVDSRIKEYCALCEMLGIQPTETLFERIEQECVSMKQKLQQTEEEKYIATVISEIMEDLGCKSQGVTALQHVQGEMYEIAGCTHCEVFVGKQGNSILFEPIIDSREGSEIHRKEAQSEIVSVCSLYDEIERRAAERGVILKRVFFEPVSVDTATTKSKKTSGKSKKKTEKNKKQKKNKSKEMALGDD